MTVELMPPVETVTPREDEAHAIEQHAGYVVVEIMPSGRAAGGLELDLAIARAIALAKSLPGSRFGIFKLVRDYQTERPRM